MRRGGSRRDRLRPVLLSGLVFPGLGQLTSGRPWAALAFAGTSVALAVVFLRRVIDEALRRMPVEAEALLDPALPFRLAVEIQRDNSAFFLWVTLGLALVWALSVLDAWMSGSPDRRR